MATRKATKKQHKSPKRYSRKQRAVILAEAKAKGWTGNQVAEKYGIARITYYLWRTKAGARGWHGVGRRVAWTPTVRKAREKLPSKLKRGVRAIVAQVISEEVASCLDEIDSSHG